jgi:thioredoxin-related protein
MKPQTPIPLLAALFLAAVTILSLPSHAAVTGAKPLPLSGGWTNDFEAARKKAAAENKNLLLDFTGSDWCGPCITLKKTILSQDAFKQGVKEHFVLVELDYPRDKSLLSPETVEQNRKLAERYSIRSFPTVLLVDPEGRPFSQVSLFSGGPEEGVKKVNEALTILRDRDKAFASAEKLNGPDKAKALFSALEAMKLRDQHIATFYGDVVEQIRASDPGDESGVVKTLEMKSKMENLLKELKNLGRSSKLEEALALVENALTSGDFEGEMKQQVAYEKVRLLRHLKQDDAAIQAADEAVAIAPDGKWVRLLEGIKSQIEKPKDSD